MRTRRLWSFVAVLAFLLGARAGAGEEAEREARLAAAKELFARFVELERSFDPAVADLYADDAVIRNTRRYPGGEVKEITLPAAKYRTLIRATMPLAKLRGDRSAYSDVTYEVEGKGVRIRADRFSEMKRYHSPYSLLVAPAAGGEWRVVEELVESQP